MDKEIDTLKEYYQKYLKFKDKFGPENILCKKYHNEYSKKAIPLINNRLYKKKISKTPTLFIESFPWQLI